MTLTSTHWHVAGQVSNSAPRPLGGSALSPSRSPESAAAPPCSPKPVLGLGGICPEGMLRVGVPSALFPVASLLPQAWLLLGLPPAPAGFPFQQSLPPPPQVKLGRPGPRSVLRTPSPPAASVRRAWVSSLTSPAPASREGPDLISTLTPSRSKAESSLHRSRCP